MGDKGWPAANASRERRLEFACILCHIAALLAMLIEAALHRVCLTFQAPNAEGGCSVCGGSDKLPLISVVFLGSILLAILFVHI
jgi:hypothetical protein